MTNPASSDHWRALLHETHAVQQLSDQLTRQTVHNGVVDEPLQRSYLVRRAVLADRADSLQKDTTFAINSEVDADLAARHLLDWDREHDTSRGLVPAADPCWDTHPRHYVHQEHAVLAHNNQRGDPDQHRPA
ncbi:hypothetical protein OG800_50675 (plasmid) [Streptomyces sp. NBC_00445]|uniref:hypothetical protein n=1 Tax=Streptomyces sp. NBC_00445 TaxID=2975745 RepID=UPI002E209AE5